ncbi:unnamed protein product [Victoria cruziana]
MRAAWLFREAAIKHGSTNHHGDIGDIYGEEGDDSEWETASESDIENAVGGEAGNNGSWQNDDQEKAEHEKSSKADLRLGYKVHVAEEEK